ncbi:MAG: Rieske (2Fe-2S) protein [Myxococcales bacterium]|nr:MAG: Rieske (2Fe-2S) protein [Myxococcales bacterium]
MQRTPPRLPSSWYVVAWADEIVPGVVTRLHTLEQEMVAFRAADGSVAVLDAYCPHLGAHLGMGGRVEKGTLRCPFHGWRFDGSGSCVEIPYASRIPPRARVARQISVEKNGLVLVWFDEAGRPPFFEVPELPEWEDERYSRRWIRYEWILNTHPQEMVENGLDWHHFPTVHRMERPRNPRFRFEGPTYTWDIDAAKDYTLQDLREDFDLGGENWGLGYSVTRQKGAFRTCIVTGMTPIDRGTVCIKLGVIARRDGESDEAIESALQKYVEEHAVVATQDFEIWENKLYRPNPILCEEDGPIAEYRRWVRQFYP